MKQGYIMRLRDLIGSSLFTGFIAFMLTYVGILIILLAIAFPFIFSLVIGILIFMIAFIISYEYV